MSPTNADLNKVKKEITRVKKNRPDSQRRRQMRRRQGKEGTKKQTPPHAQAQNSNKDPANKKAHEGDGEILAIKVLIPSSAVAAIIGECGVVMNTLRKDHKCQIQISKNETYPGTLEQICIMKGSLRNILAVIESIQEKIRMKCADQVGNDAFDHANTLRRNEAKIVMPNTSAGMVIGKHRTTIKLFPKHFGCQIQVFPKSVEAKAALERVVTVAHEDSAILLGAVRRVLQKVALDPHHCSEIKDEDFKDNKNSQIVRSPVKVEEIEEMKPFLCTKSEKMCFNRLKEEYMLTGEIGGCPTPVSDHPTADDIRQWAIGYEAIRKY